MKNWTSMYVNSGTAKAKYLIQSTVGTTNKCLGSNNIKLYS